MITSVDPTATDLQRLLAEAPQDTPVVMVNLLKFRDRAEYAEGQGEPGASGRDAYATYARAITPILRGVGGKPIWQGEARSTFIAPPGETWDEVLLVRYPSAQAFMGMLRLPEYRAITHHRAAALENSRLILTVASDDTPA